MPNAARLTAALTLGCVAALLSACVMPLFEAYRGTDVVFGSFVYVNMAIGVWVGWTSLGARAGRGRAAALSNGASAVLLLVFWALLVHSGSEMMRRALRGQYDGPLEALNGLMQVGMEWALVLLAGSTLAVMGLGACATGLLTEFASRRWR